MATIWAIADHGGEWARDALRRAGHVVLVMCAAVAYAKLELNRKGPDIVLLDLSAEDAYGVCDEFRAVQMLCLGVPGNRVDMAMGSLLTNGAPVIPNARGHELELVGAVRLQLERAGVEDE